MFQPSALPDVMLIATEDSSSLAK